MLAQSEQDQETLSWEHCGSSAALNPNDRVNAAASAEAPGCLSRVLPSRNCWLIEQ